MRIEKFTQKMQEALQAAQDIASQFNHQEISNEHFLSALLDQSEGITRPLLEKIGVPINRLHERLASENVPAAKILKDLGVTRDKLMQALQQVRGSQRVTDQNPEGKYQTLEKYGRDLTELAR